MSLHSLTVGPFQENTWLVIDDESGAAVLVDPGDEPDRIADMVLRHNCTLRAIWLTHAHLDHVGAIAGIKRKWDVPIFLHPEDRVLYDAADRQAALYGLPFDRPPAPDHDLADGDSIPVGAQVFSVMHVPGHAPGHVIFVGDNLIIGGDLIFMDSIGRTDLPGSDPVAMSQSLQRVAALPPHLAVHPGHGPSTTLARELHHNPFLSGRARVPGG